MLKLCLLAFAAATGEGGERQHQREGMGLLEYQAMPSFRDVDHDCVLSTFSNRSAPGRNKWCGPSGQAAWSVHHVQNHTRMVTVPSSQPGGPPCWTSPLAFGLIGQHPEASTLSAAGSCSNV